MRYSEMAILDVPQVMPLLRVLKDRTDPIPTEFLLIQAMRRTLTRRTVMTRVQHMMALERLLKDQYVWRTGTGKNAHWLITQTGITAVTLGKPYTGIPKARKRPSRTPVQRLTRAS